MVQLPYLVPPSSKEQELACRISKLQEALAVTRELHEFTKDRNNVHAPIKKMSVSILSSLTCIERELLTMKMRVERIKKASMKPKAGYTDLGEEKQEEEAEEIKRAKNDAPTSNQPASEPSEEQEKPESSELWSTVVSKKTKHKATIDSATDVRQGRPDASNGPTKLTSWRPKTKAILVETNEVSTHKDILRKLKTDPKLEPFGKQVTRVRSTKNGGLLFELKKNEGTYSEDYSEKIQKAIGESGKVKTLGQMETVEIRYFDEETEAADVEREMRNQFTCTEGCKLEVRMKSSYSASAGDDSSRENTNRLVSLPSAVNATAAGKRATSRKTTGVQTGVNGVCVAEMKVTSLLRAKKPVDIQRASFEWSILPTDEKNNIMEVVQINLNHCETAQDLLSQVLIEEEADIAIISEPYRAPIGSTNWVADKTGAAAIWAVRRYPIQRVVSKTFEGFCIAEVNGVFFASCYAPPSWEPKIHNNN
uniref:Endonuclease/exonuclease/phosphatase domain-containing protein n=1 Tax=Anopheles arabiensis TaxID=7173 RepID=A0A182IE95_ANOAR